jgi:hypothetical protein
MDFDHLKKTIDYLKTTIFHITQYKAGSQWIYHILRRCDPERIVPPKLGVSQFVEDPIVQGRIYPTVYVTREVYERTRKPVNSAYFIILRDLRDILVSAYFSVKYSHPPLNDRMATARQELFARNVEDGYIWLMENWLSESANIGRSWVQNGEEWIRYEDLLIDDVGILERTLIDRCRLGIDRRVFREAILECRFAKLSGGRMRGEEDPNSHTRKGVSGDWKVHFTPKVISEFKDRFGDLLIRSKYTDDNDW